MSVETLTTRVDRVEISMDYLRRLVAETTENVNRLSARVDQTSAAVDRLSERLDRGAAETRANLDRLSERLDRGAAETRANLDRLSARVDQTSETVDRLGARVDQTSATVDRLGARVDQTSEMVDRLGARVDQTSEMVDRLGARVDQTSATVDRLGARVDQTSAAVDQLSQEMKEFKAEMQRSREENLAEHKRFRQELANIAQSMGRLVEDIVAPSMPGILPQVIPCEEGPRMLGVRISKRINGRSQEYDVLAICGEYLLITEVKTRLRTGDVAEFLNRLAEARTFLPEYAENQIIGALATFYVDESHVREAEGLGLVVLGIVDGLMQVLNQQNFRPVSL